MGDAESLPASPRAGLSPRRISRQEPVEGEEAGAGEGGGGGGGRIVVGGGKDKREEGGDI